ncbi:MAG: universal stress protein [Gammaproteobacteria bacterium]
MNILVTVDFSNTTDRVMQVTSAIAHGNDAHVYLLHVADPEPDFMGYDAGPEVVRDQVAHSYNEAHRHTQKLAESLRGSGLEATALTIQGAIVESVLDQAEKLDAGFIVVGSHGHGAVYDLLVGSISEGIVRQSARPVLVVPARDKDDDK